MSIKGVFSSFKLKFYSPTYLSMFLYFSPKSPDSK